jgi:hypothetical protein
LNSAPPKFILLLPALLFTFVVNARSNVTPGTGRSAGMGNTFVSQYDLDAALHNQAGVSSLKSVTIAVYFEDRFMLKAFSSRGIVMGIPTTNGVFSTALHTFGPSKWAESTFTLGYSKQLSPTLSGGVQLNYFAMKLPEENQWLSSVGAELGFIYQLSPTLFIGAHLANPFSIPFHTTNYLEKIPWCITIGGHALITNTLTIAVEAEKTGGRLLLFKAGMEWEAIDHFFLRGGYNSGPTHLFYGIGFTYRFITADLAFGYHELLGVTPSFSIKFKIK